MGLDMYLFVEKCETKLSCENKDYPKGFYPKELDCLAKKHWKDNFLSIHSKYQIGYWRKFYPLHHWFVNYSRENDYCQEIIIGEENLRDLLKRLKNVKNAEELINLLDPKDILDNVWGDYYLECLDYTIKLFERVLRFIKNNNNYRIIYQASW